MIFLVKFNGLFSEIATFDVSMKNLCHTVFWQRSVSKLLGHPVHLGPVAILSDWIKTFLFYC